MKTVSSAFVELTEAALIATTHGRLTTFVHTTFFVVFFFFEIR
jgi:hypothetical protein